MGRPDRVTGMTYYRIVKSNLRKDSSTDFLVVDENDDAVGYLDEVEPHACEVIDQQRPADPGPLQIETVCNTGLAVAVGAFLALLVGFVLGLLIGLT